MKTKADCGKLGGRARVANAKAKAAAGSKPILDALADNARSSRPVGCDALVALSKDDIVVGGPICSNAALHRFCEFPIQARGSKAPDHTNELSLVLDNLRDMSTSSKANASNKSRQYISRRGRQLALFMVSHKNVQQVANVRSIYEQLIKKYGRANVKGLLCIIKYKYDEMSLLCSVDEGESLEAVTAIAKLLVMTLDVHCLFRVNFSYVSMSGSYHTCVLPLHKTSGYV